MADVRVNDYRLMRARDGRMLAGVGAGLAQACGLDVTLVRLCIGAMVLSGFGVAAYILMWIILPEESPRRGRIIEPAPEHTARIIRIALVSLAALSLFNKVGGFWGFANPHARGVGFDGALGLILLGIGIAVLFTRHRPDRALWETTPPPTVRVSRDPAPVGDEDDDGTPKYAGPLADAFGTVHEALSDAFSEVRTTLAESRPRRDTATDGAYTDDDEDYAAATLPVVTVTGDTNRSGGAALVAARVVGWLALIWWALASLAIAAGWALGFVTMRSPILLGVVSFVVFIGVLNTLLHAKFARAIVPALALLVIPIAIAVTTVRVPGDIGDFVHHPTAVSGTLNYRQALGRMTLDFENTRFTEDSTINARLGVGQLVVIVPSDVAVTVNTRTTGTGAFVIFGRRSNGVSPDNRVTYTGCEGAPRIVLNLRTGVGETEVRRANGANRGCTGRQLIPMP